MSSKSRVKKYYRINNDDYRFVCTVAGLLKKLPEELAAEGAMAIANHYWEQLKKTIPARPVAPAEVAGDGTPGSTSDTPGTLAAGGVEAVPGPT